MVARWPAHRFGRRPVKSVAGELASPMRTIPYPKACKARRCIVGAGLAPALVPIAHWPCPLRHRSFPSLLRAPAFVPLLHIELTSALVPHLYRTIGISTPNCSNIPAIPPPETCSTRMKAIVLPLTAYSQCSSGSKTDLFVAGMGGNPSSKT